MEPPPASLEAMVRRPGAPGRAGGSQRIWLAALLVGIGALAYYFWIRHPLNAFW
jgi:hypothetical protein